MRTFNVVDLPIFCLPYNEINFSIAITPPTFYLQKELIKNSENS